MDISASGGFIEKVVARKVAAETLRNSPKEITRRSQGDRKEATKEITAATKDEASDSRLQTSFLEECLRGSNPPAPISQGSSQRAAATFPSRVWNSFLSHREAEVAALVLLLDESKPCEKSLRYACLAIPDETIRAHAERWKTSSAVRLKWLRVDAKSCSKNKSISFHVSGPDRERSGGGSY